MPVENIYISSDNFVRLNGLMDAQDRSWANSATVTAKLIDSNGDDVSGSSFSLTYVTDSDGDYEGSMADTVSLTENASYKYEIIATQSGVKKTWRIPVTAVYKKLEN